MASAAARYGHSLSIAVLICLWGCTGSGGAGSIRVVDLIHEFDRAERRPGAGRFQVAVQDAGGVARPAIVVPAPSRVTWSLPLPRHGTFHSFVAVKAAAPGTRGSPIRFRIGVSDYRTYEGLAEITVPQQLSGWADLRADLSAYAGWKWSLFYHPDRVIWRVVLAADALSGVPAMAVWGAPEIVTDTQSAKEYAARRRRLQKSPAYTGGAE